MWDIKLLKKKIEKTKGGNKFIFIAYIKFIK